MDGNDDAEQDEGEPHPQVDRPLQPPGPGVAPGLVDQPSRGRPDQQREQGGGARTPVREDDPRRRELPVAEDEVVDGDDDERAAHGGNPERSLGPGRTFSRRAGGGWSTTRGRRSRPLDRDASPGRAGRGVRSRVRHHRSIMRAGRASSTGEDTQCRKPPRECGRPARPPRPEAGNGQPAEGPQFSKRAGRPRSGRTPRGFGLGRRTPRLEDPRPGDVSRCAAIVHSAPVGGGSGSIPLPATLATIASRSCEPDPTLIYSCPDLHRG